MQHFKLWQHAWKPTMQQPIEITLPCSWKVEYHDAEGDFWPVMTADEICDTINTPLGMPRISELAKGGRQTCIVFDDLSRGTPVQPLAEMVLAELAAAGMPNENIRFLCALGTHGPMSRDQMVKKVGEHIIEHYRVINHNPFDNLVRVGADFAGKDVMISREFMECDVRIGIGSCCPHTMAGYGGGGKLLFPGIAGFGTSISNHNMDPSCFSPMGDITATAFRREIDSLTNFCAPFFKIDTVLNTKLDIVGIAAGEASAARDAAMEISSHANALIVNDRTPRDVVIVNANAKCNEPFVAINIANRLLKKGGDIVLVNFDDVGNVLHYLMGYWGEHCHGPVPMWKERGPAHWGRVIYYTPYPEYAAKDNFENPDKVIFARTWNSVLRLLSSHGNGTTASVVCDGTNTYIPGLEHF